MKRAHLVMKLLVLFPVLFMISEIYASDCMTGGIPSAPSSTNYLSIFFQNNTNKSFQLASYSALHGHIIKDVSGCKPISKKIVIKPGEAKFVLLAAHTAFEPGPLISIVFSGPNGIQISAKLKQNYALIGHGNLNSSQSISPSGAAVKVSIQAVTGTGSNGGYFNIVVSNK